MHDVAGRNRAQRPATGERPAEARRAGGSAPGAAGLVQLGDAFNRSPRVIELKRLAGGLSAPIQRVQLRPDGRGGYNKMTAHRMAVGDIETSRLSAGDRAHVLSVLRPDQHALHEEIVAEAAHRDEAPWVFIVGRNAYAWGGDPSIPPAERPLPPALWHGFEQLPEVPVGKAVLTLQQYSVMMRGGGPRAASDSYNPYGRFATAEHSSFIPSDLDAQGTEMLLRHLEQKEGSFIHPNRLERRFAEDGSHVLVDQERGITLHPYPQAVGFGTHYSSVALPPGPVRAARTIQPDAEAGVRVHAPFEIPKATIDAMSGVERSAQQSQVMGNRSAAMVAEGAGFDPEIGWEWLHLVAHSMGGLPGVGPQRAENLVAGTSAANSEMIIAEEFLKDMIRRTNATLRLSVQTEMLTPLIAKTISYDALLTMPNEAQSQQARQSVYHWTFDCLTTVHPQASWNRQVRTHGRASMGLLGDRDDPDYGMPHMQQSISHYQGPDRLAVRMETELDETEQAPKDHEGSDEGLTPEDIAASYGRYAGWDIGQIVEAYAAFPALRVPFMTALIRYHPDAEFLHELRGALLELGDGLPGEIASAFADPEPYPAGSDSDGDWDSEDEAGSADAMDMGDQDDGDVRHETSKSGNCLFEAVNIVLNNGPAMDRVLRQLCTQYFVNHPGLAVAAGVGAQDVITTLSTPGRWAGNAGDLSPAILASAIGRNIEIVTDHGMIVAEAARVLDATPVRIYLSGGHFTVHPVTPAHQAAGSRTVISVRDKVGSP